MQLPVVVAMIGLLVVVAILVKAVLRRIGVPELVGYLTIGMAVSAADWKWAVLSREATEILTVMGDLGLIALLFRIGVEADLQALIAQLRRASVIWVTSVIASAAVGYLVAGQLLGLGQMPSLFVAASLTATSIAAGASVWRDAGLVQTDEYQCFLDVAELDEVTGIVAMGVLLEIAPLMRADSEGPILWHVLRTTGIYLVELLVIGLGCFLFARFLQRPLLEFFDNLEITPDRIISILGIGMLIAAGIAGLGFTVGVGAFLAGLTFSRARDLVTDEQSFKGIYDFLAPFFLISMGLRVNPTAFGAMLGIGGVLLLAAIVGKWLGTVAGAGLTMGRSAAVVLSISTVPRAEIALVVLDAGHRLGPWAMPENVFSGMVLVVALTCLLTPPVLRWSIDRVGLEGQA